MTSIRSNISFSVGIDFDNTLVSYDSLIHLVASERKLIGPETSPNKKLIRDTIRKLPNGDVEWQKVQASVYGPRIGEATPAPGVAEFLEECVRHEAKINIVSHKTKFANYDETSTNLRTAALSWLEQHRFLDSALYGLSSETVFFEPTRLAKVAQIERLMCSHFVDDLDETFLEETFPYGVKKFLYSLDPVVPTVADVELTGDWWQIKYHLFCTSE